jgi:hypothetical protein
MNKRKGLALTLIFMIVCLMVPFAVNAAAPQTAAEPPSREISAAGEGSISVPVPEKVQIIQTSQGALQFDYDSTLPGAANRAAFVEAVLDMQAPHLLLILAGGQWYDVNGITLREAVEEGKIVELPEDPADLTFDPGAYETLNIILDGQPVEVRKYTVTYVANPIEMQQSSSGGGFPWGGTPAPFDPYGYQKMIIYVPQSAYSNTETAVILNVNNAGWMTSAVGTSVTDGGAYVSGSNTDATGAALAAGYVVVNAGTRSRGALGADGSWPGKAPAVVVDAKAAIRYLRLNDAAIPGSSEKIIITGTSGGGGLSVAVAASGNSADYYPYLQEIGAAGFDAGGSSTLRDDVYATVAYCPITDLGNADIAYEWQYGFLRTEANGTPADQIAAAAELAARYPTYVASLGLETETGAPLTAEGIREAIVDFVTRDIEEAIAGETAGVGIPALGENFTFPGFSFGDFVVPDTVAENDWLEVQNGAITFFDYDKYLTFVSKCSALKGVPSFDSTAVTGTTALSGENSLFGSKEVEYANFAQWSWDNNQIPGDGSGPDDTGKTWDQYITGSELEKQIKMVSPLPYLGKDDADAAPFWYVRHGMRDRDTAFAVELLLYYGVYNDSSVKDLNFELAWLEGHGGNYDVQEAYAWVADIL